MNLLNYRGRFAHSKNIVALEAYTWALQDVLKLMEELTEFNPSKRMVDSVTILEAIEQTNEAVTEKTIELRKELEQLKTVDLGGAKTHAFLKEQLTDPDDLKGVL